VSAGESNTFLALVALAALVCVWKLPEVYRTRRIRSLIPGAIVLSTGKNPELEKALTRLSDAVFITPRRPLPAEFSLVAEPTRLSLWRGFGREFLDLNWSVVVNLEVHEINDITRISKGILVNVRSENGTIALPFVITGHGPFGAFAKTEAQLMPIVEAIERYRADAPTASPAS
jgi:hypothetical protein